MPESTTIYRSGTSRGFSPPVIFAFIMAICAATGVLRAESSAWQMDAYDFRREVNLPAGSSPSIVVADFFAHGALDSGTRNIAVFSGRKAVPYLVLQRGPGDYCRIAFQTEDRQSQYHIYYGGPAAPHEMPPWTAGDGLAMETRVWQPCNLNNFQSVRDAFASSRRIGADFVPRVFHRDNPFDARKAPFMSRYSGTLNLPVSGKVKFFTASQDASFLLIDGRLIVSAAGRHAPDASGRISGEIELNEGPHKFEYYHAASGERTCMVAAWQLPGFDKPFRISPQVFRDARIAHLPAVRLEHRTARFQPDFRMAILGGISTNDELPMVRVQFVDTTSPKITSNAKYSWDFGDGQRSVERNPGHVYHYPGTYSVTLTSTRGTDVRQVTQRVWAERPIIDESEFGSDSFASNLSRLNARSLAPIELVQLVRAYLDAEEWDKAIAAGNAALTGKSSDYTDETLWELSCLVGPVLTDRQGDFQRAAELYCNAANRIERREWSVACVLAAADIYLNDLMLHDEARALLDVAKAENELMPPAIIAKLHRLEGDWLARTSDGKRAVANYWRAQKVRKLAYDSTEQANLREAHGRSCERLLADGNREGLRKELNRWTDELPADTIEGFRPLMRMGYWIRGGRYPQAITVACDGLTVNNDSMVADRMLYLMALCHARLENAQQARATLEALIVEYPESPLVDLAKAQSQRLLDGKPLTYIAYFPEEKGGRKKSRPVERHPAAKASFDKIPLPPEPR